jgi:lysophospholipase L1-like esterase
MPQVQDDNLMERFETEGSRRFRARDAIVAVVVAAIVLVIIEGSSIRTAGEQMKPGIEHDVVLGIGRPAGWLSDRLPFHSAATKLTAGLSPDTKLADVGGFAATTGAAGAENSVPQVTPSAFDPASIGARPAPKRALHTLLVTGDSLSTPLDVEIARRMTSSGVHVIREPHLGTGISKTDLVDWGKLSATQVKEDHPDAVVVFIGANEGFPMPGPARKQVSCCGADWAAIYANRVRQMMNTYRRNGTTRLYWITVPTPRDPARQRIQRVVNAAISVAAQPWRNDISLIDTVPIFTPGGRYRDAMPVNGRPTLVRESDGIHLNRTGAGLLAQRVIGALQANFTY